MSSNDNFYQILGVDPNATSEEIKKAYKKRALQTHPDRLPKGHSAADKQAAEEEFRKVNHAYEVLMNSDNRKAYDLYGVWPPPEELPQQARGESSRPHDPFIPSFHDPFNDPFFRSGPFFSRHTPFVFRDPFELFNSIFAELDHDPFDPLSSRSPFGPSLFGGGFFGNQSLFPTRFSRPEWPPSMFGRGFGNMLDFPEGSNVRSYSYSSSSRGFLGRDGEGPQWVSERTVQRTINGVTQTIHEKRDSQGNVHIRKVYPDGREQYTINGVEQPVQPRSVEGGPSHGALPPPPAQLADTSVPIRSSNMREEYVPVRHSTSARDRDQREDPPYVPPHTSSTHHASRKEKRRESMEYPPSRHSSRSHREHDRRSHRYEYEPAPAPHTSTPYARPPAPQAVYGESQPGQSESRRKKHWWDRH